MSGRWRISPEAIGPHDHLLIETGSGILLSLNDPRRFGSLDLVPSSDLTAFPAFAAMGPEPLGPELSATYLLKALSGRAAPIKALLLDQRIGAGLGNIRSEEHTSEHQSLMRNSYAVFRLTKNN